MIEPVSLATGDNVFVAISDTFTGGVPAGPVVKLAYTYKDWFDPSVADAGETEQPDTPAGQTTVRL
jgi:hypothetical protein